METTPAEQGDIPLIGSEAFELDADFSALGIALRNILLLRRSQREFAPGPVPQYRFSRLLWAACGCNRDGGALRTVPSVCGGVAIDLYVALENGLYRFDAGRMLLARHLEADLRSRAGDGTLTAPIELIYVADLGRMAGVPAGDRLWQAALDAGFMAENVSLFCAAEGLATCVRVPPGSAALADAMAQHEDCRVLLLQQVGILKDAPERNPWM